MRESLSNYKLSFKGLIGYLYIHKYNVYVCKVQRELISNPFISKIHSHIRKYPVNVIAQWERHRSVPKTRIRTSTWCVRAVELYVYTHRRRRDVQPNRIISITGKFPKHSQSYTASGLLSKRRDVLLVKVR